jgi:hypothetical protein
LLFTSYIPRAEPEATAKRQAIYCNTWRVFCNDPHGGEGDPNVYGAPSHTIYGRVFVINSDNPEAIAQVKQELLPGGSLGSVFPSLTTTMNDRNIPFIPNLNILLLPRASTPYPLYPGLPLPTYQEDEDTCGSYHPHFSTPEPVEEVSSAEEPGVSPGEEWVLNIHGLEPLVNYTIPGLEGCLVMAPFI